MNATEVFSSPSRNVRNPATDANHFILTFENNRLASELFGQFDQHLKLLEQRLQIEARAQRQFVPHGRTPGHQPGPPCARFPLCPSAERRLGIEASDVEGAIRMAVAADDQHTLPTLERKAKLSMAQNSTPRKTIAARTPTQDAYMRALERSEMVFGVGPAG